MWDNQEYSLGVPGCPTLTPFRLVWDTLVSPTSTICPTSSPGFPLVPSQTERMPRTMSPEWAHAMLNTYTIPPRATRAQNMRLQAAGANSCSVSSSLSLKAQPHAAMLHTCDGVFRSSCDAGKLLVMICDVNSNMFNILLPILE